MFDFLKNPQRISDLTTQKALLEIKVQQLENKLEHLASKESKEDTTLQSFSIDFQKLDVFSIERNKGKTELLPCTIIGHFLTNAEGVKHTAEWYLYCSPETHNKIVKEFNEFKLKGTNGTK